MAMISLVVLVVIFVASLLAPLIAPFPRDQIELGRTFITPMTTDPRTGQLHILGTDHLGRDYFTRLLYAGRVSLTVAVTVSTISSLIGIILGLLAGYFGGWVDTADHAHCSNSSRPFPPHDPADHRGDSAPERKFHVLPGFVTGSSAAVMAVPEREAKQVALIIFVLALLGWTGTARLMRGMVLSVREQPYIESSRALGASNTRIIRKHVFPNAFPPLIVDYTLGMNGALVLESALSFLGFGIQDPTPTWGNMLAFANSYMFNHPWMPLVPGLPILICSLAINYVGDGLRDALDPRMKL